MEPIHLELWHDDDGPYFIATFANENGVEKWLATPLDPIGHGIYDGRLQLIARAL